MPETNGNANACKQLILSKPLAEFDKTFLESLFASYFDKTEMKQKDSAFNPETHIKLTHEEYPYVKDEIETSLGMLFMNRFLLEYVGVIQYLGYWNHSLNKKKLGKLNTAVNNLVVLDKIDTKTLGQFVDRRDQLGFQSAPFLATSISATLVRPMHDVNQRKLELLQEHQKELQSNNPTDQILAMNAIEKELMGMVRKNLHNDYGADMYESGDGNLDNNYKTINVMRGAVMNDITGKFDIVGASLMDGIQKKDIPAFSNSIVAGAYPSAIGTGEAGYMAKIILALLQSEHIDPDPNSDCGTNVTIPLTITDSNKQYVLYRYINQSGKKTLLTVENIDQYVGETVNVYSPQCCTHDAICGKCAGLVFHNLGVTNVGLLVTSITQKLLNIKLKSKHDLSESASIIKRDIIFETPNKFFDIEDGFVVNKTTMRIFIPRMFEEISGFSLEATKARCFGVLPVKFYSNSGQEILSTRMTVPTMLTFNVYDDIQEEPDYYILNYAPGSRVCSVAIRQNVANVELFLNQIYIHSRTPQLPYNMLTEMMFRCMEINKIDLTGPSIAYEMLARRLCRHGTHPFAMVYGKNPNVNPLSYEKIEYRSAVQRAGILQGLLFEDISTAINVGLSQTYDGVKPVETPLEKVIKA